MKCPGTPEQHCCWVQRADIPTEQAMAEPELYAVGVRHGKVEVAVRCPFFDENGPPGEHCSLRSELGSWEAVHKDRRYKYLWMHLPAIDKLFNCGDWPPAGFTCEMCGQTGDGRIG